MGMRRQQLTRINSIRGKSIDLHLRRHEARMDSKGADARLLYHYVSPPQHLF